MSEDEENKGKKITVQIDRTPEVESVRAELERTKAELAEKKAILEERAVEAFEQKKDELRRMFPQASDTIDISSAEGLDVLEANLKQKYPHKAPMGKATMKYQGEAEFSSNREMLDELYRQAENKPDKNGVRPYSSSEQNDAKNKIDQLIESMSQGRAWKQIKQRGIGEVSFMSCPKCNSTIDLSKESKCYNCGFELHGSSIGSKRGRD